MFGACPLYPQKRTSVEQLGTLQIGYDRIKSLYFENPNFGFYLLRLTSARLFQNIAKFEVELEKRDREILRLRASTDKNNRGRVSKASRQVNSGAIAA